jgi:hypothetical protein
VYGGGEDYRVERRGRTGGSPVHPCGSVNCLDELRVVLMVHMHIKFHLDMQVDMSSVVVKGLFFTEV